MECNFKHKIQADLYLVIHWEAPAKTPDEHFTRCYLERELQALALRTQIKLEGYANKIASEQALAYEKMFNTANPDPTL